jgi:serine/threonine-protein kinase
MSPESCVGREVTGASDQYALGVVGYELLAGRNPFLADTSVGIMYAHVHESPQPIGELRPDCPSEMAAAIMRMFDKNVAAPLSGLRQKSGFFIVKVGNTIDKLRLMTTEAWHLLEGWG